MSGMFLRVRDVFQGADAPVSSCFFREIGMVPVLLEKVAEMAAQVVVEAGCTMADVAWFPGGRHAILRVLVDKPEGGPTVDDCAVISRHLGGALELHDIMPDAYRLEVSSPGLNRPLKTYNDRLSRENFSRFSGKLAIIKTIQPWIPLTDTPDTPPGASGVAEGPGRKKTRKGQRMFKGYLQGMDANDVLIQVQGETVRVPLDQISKAHLEFEF